MTVDPAIGHHHYCGFSSYNKAVWGIRFKLTPFFCQVSTCFQVLCPKLILFLLKRTISHRALFKSYHPLPKHTQMEQSLHQEWSKLFIRQKLWANGSVRHSPFHERASSSWLFAFCFFRHWNTPPIVSYCYIHTIPNLLPDTALLESWLLIHKTRFWFYQLMSLAAHNEH